MASYSVYTWQSGMGGSTPIVASPLNNEEQGIYDAHQELLELIPTGMIAFHSMSTPPTGWFECDGSEKSRTTYAALYAALGGAGSVWGQGNGTSTFNVPDLRGCFLRGLDESKTYDTGRTLGSYQADQNTAHTHTYDENVMNDSATNGSGGGYAVSKTGRQTRNTGYTGSEFKPRNIALLPVIKWS